jgi:hypothetical protein
MNQWPVHRYTLGFHLRREGARSSERVDADFETSPVYSGQISQQVHLYAADVQRADNDDDRNPWGDGQLVGAW